MADPDIENTTGAFGPLIQDGQPFSGQSPASTVRTVVNTGNVAITAGQWVRPDVSGATGKIFGVLVQSPALLDTRCIGISLDAIAVNGTGRIVTAGPAYGIAGTGGVTNGQQISPSATSGDIGQLVNASSPTTGQVIGISCATQATHGGTFPIWVAKS